MVQFTFDARGVAASYGSDGGGLPPGKHKVIIEASEIKPAASNPQNQYLQFNLKCVEGLAAGGMQIDRLNLHNTNQQTVTIAQSQLAAYCAVLGRPGFNATEELHNIPFFIEVRPQRNNPEYTEVAKLYDLNGNEARKSGGGSGSQMAPAPQAPPAGFGPAPTAAQPWQAPQAAPVIEPAPAQQWTAPAPAPAPAAAPAAPWAPAAGGAAPGWGQR